MAHQVSLEVLSDVITRALARWPEGRGRIERAATLIALGHVEQVGPDTYRVRSQGQDDVTYIVNRHGCTCVDAQRHPHQPCKHQWGVELLQIAEERERRLAARQAEQAARARFSADAVALAYARSIRWAA